MENEKMSEIKESWKAIKELIKNGVQTTSNVGIYLEVNGLKLVIINALMSLYNDSNGSHIQYVVSLFRSGGVPITFSSTLNIDDDIPCCVSDIIRTATSDKYIDKALDDIKKSIEVYYSKF